MNVPSQRYDPFELEALNIDIVYINLSKVGYFRGEIRMLLPKNNVRSALNPFYNRLTQ